MGNGDGSRLGNHQAGGFRLRNVGNSPAFDIVVDTLRLPTGQTAITPPTSLGSSTIHALAAGEKCEFVHKHFNERDLLTKQEAGLAFVDDLDVVFSQMSRAEGFVRQRELVFELMYRNLSRDTFRVKCPLLFDRALNRVWLEPKPGWLG